MIRKIISIGILLPFALVAAASVYSVSNDGSFPADYTNLQTAINSVSDGDTLYVYGSTSSYGNISINKPIVLIGTGHNPQDPSVNYTRVDVINMYTEAAGSTISGLKLDYDYINVVTQVNNVTVENCFIFYGSSRYFIWNVSNSDNWTIRGNVLRHTYSSSSYGLYVGTNNDNWTITNNVIYGTYGYLLLNANSTTVFSNNLVIVDRQFFNNCSNATISNNIFINYGSDTTNFNTGCTGCQMDNNLTYSADAEANGLSLPEIPDANNTGSGNLNNTFPKMTQFPSNAQGFDYSHDYHLLTGSPCIGTGTGGTDIGIYGGNGFIFSMYGYPVTPRIIDMNIKNAFLPENGSLKIELGGTTER